MSPKITLTICSAVMLFPFYMYFINTENVVLTRFPDAESYAIGVGMTLHQIMGTILLALGSLLFVTRGIEGESNQKTLLLGAASAFAIVDIGYIYTAVVNELTIALPIVILSTLVALCLWSRSRIGS